MQRYRGIIAYDGLLFSGYQVQPQKRTVQGELEAALRKLHKGIAVKVFASGRTDAGVHAKGQVIHFDSNLSIPTDRWAIALNTILPDDISVIEVVTVQDTFHARFDAKGKEYRYFVQRSKIRDPHSRNYTYHYPYALDIASMRTASKDLLGKHDFTSFCSAKTEVLDRVRELHAVEIVEEDSTMIFRFVGDGFLYNMVRIMVGTLLQIGNGELAVDSIPQMLMKHDRTVAGKTAPPQGLYLWEVFY